MFDKYKYVKVIGAFIIALAVIIYILTGVRFRSVRQVQDEKESLMAENLENETVTETMPDGGTQQAGEGLVHTQLKTDEATHTYVQLQTDSDAYTHINTQTHTDLQENTQTDSHTQESLQAEDTIKCTIEIRCDKAVEKKDSVNNPGIINIIPDDGCILKITEYQAESGFTVYDVLSRVALMNDIDIVSNSDKTYISSIGGLAQKMVGSGSGWTYRVNGELVMRPACYCEVSDGDVITWIYVTGATD